MKGVHLITALFTGLLLGAPEPTNTPTASPPAACTEPEFRQFDFWLGRWKVSSPEGKELGRSEISRASGGCAIHEQWKSKSGITGMSINYYDSSDRKWHQDWVGSDGAILQLKGGRHEAAMILEGENREDTKTVFNRVTWTLLRDGNVRQEWVVSSDNGKTWKSSFLGIYEKQNQIAVLLSTR